MSFSISDLQKMLEERQTKVKELTRDRQALLIKLKEIDEQIEELSGEPIEDTLENTPIPQASSLKKKTVPKQKKSIRKTSIDYARDVLKRYPDGLDLEDLAEKILKEGYETKSDKFTNTLYQALYKNEEITRNDKGKYAIN